ncbi:MAG: tRNA (adenosine(37)-N6)-threonylcarbamoyltransferase complex ATPase subunit type 1 TsaE [Cryobacterium sp.]
MSDLRSGPAAETLVVADADAMHALGVRLAARLRAGDLLVLTGPLGAGKTTLSRGLGEGLRVRGPVTSPTFVLARTHPSLVGGPDLVHVDAYRLASALELDDLDIDFARSVVVVEWGRGLLDGITDSWLDVEIERPRGGSGDPDVSGDPDESGDPENIDEPRRVTITAHGPRWAANADSHPVAQTIEETDTNPTK